MRKRSRGWRLLWCFGCLAWGSAAECPPPPERSPTGQRRNLNVARALTSGSRDRPDSFGVGRSRPRGHYASQLRSRASGWGPESQPAPEASGAALLWAAGLWGMVEAVREEAGYFWSPVFQERLNRWTERARARVPDLRGEPSLGWRALYAAASGAGVCPSRFAGGARAARLVGDGRPVQAPRHQHPRCLRPK